MEEIIADAEEAGLLKRMKFAMALTNCVNDHLAEIDAGDLTAIRKNGR